jgi:hypothetical protein
MGGLRAERRGKRGEGREGVGVFRGNKMFLDVLVPVGRYCKIRHYHCGGRSSGYSSCVAHVLMVDCYRGMQLQRSHNLAHLVLPIGYLVKWAIINTFKELIASPIHVPVTVCCNQDNYCYLSLVSIINHLY